MPDMERVKGDSEVKGELNLNINLGLNNSIRTLINKYNPHIVQFCNV